MLDHNLAIISIIQCDCDSIPKGLKVFTTIHCFFTDSNSLTLNFNPIAAVLVQFNGDDRGSKSVPHSFYSNTE